MENLNAELMKYKEKLKDIYTLISEDFEKTRQNSWKETLDFLDSLSRDSLVLDCGCGTGRDTLSALDKGHRVISLDFSLGQLRHLSANHSFKELNLVLGNMIKLPFKDNSFDAILSIASIHHLTKDEQIEFLRGCRKVLKDEGRIIVSAWAFENDKFKNLKKQETLVKWGAFKRYYYLFRKGELSELFSRVGFTIEKEFLSGMNHWIIGRR